MRRLGLELQQLLFQTNQGGYATLYLHNFIANLVDNVIAGALASLAQRQYFFDLIQIEIQGFGALNEAQPLHVVW